MNVISVTISVYLWQHTVMAVSLYRPHRKEEFVIYHCELNNYRISMQQVGK